MPRYVFDLRSMALAGEVLDYFKDQFLFYNSLPLDIQKKMIIRLYPEDYGWNQKQRWLNASLKILFGWREGFILSNY